MELLYSDNKIAVCVKPVGVVSTDEPGGMPSLLRRALGEGQAVHSVHRLDAAVGGLMVFARTRHAASTLGRALQEDCFQKSYLAVIHGTPEEETGALRDLMWRDRRRRMSFVTDRPGKNVQEARLDYTVLAQADGLSLLEVRLLTGRTHQIRVQFSSRGMPLWGDKKYGLRGDEGDIALWSYRLAFRHPATGEPLSFVSEPPSAWPWTAFGEETAWKQS